MTEPTLDIRERPPIVTIMGHIDHGKTSLLDYIRKTKVQAREAGGITQHLGSYQITHGSQNITFIDTPGHEAFKSIRSRGIKTADIIIIVIAADEGIKPQTIEAIEIAKQTTLPIIVVITKIDKENIFTDKIKSELVEHNLVPEEWGGNVVVSEVSSVTGEGVNELLEMIQLVAEVQELKANYSQSGADGFILESFHDAKMGALCDIVVLNGMLSTGDVVVCGTTVYGKIRRIEDDQGNSISKAIPGQPVRVLGLKEVASPGDMIRVVSSEKEAEKIIESHRKIIENIPVLQSLKGEKELPIILKADTQGSLDAINYSLDQIAQIDMKIRILSQGLGGVTAGDILLAKNNHAAIITFGLKIDKQIKQVAEQQDVTIKPYRIIYELTDEIREILAKLTEPKVTKEVLGALRVIRVFKEDKKTLLLGGKVEEGKIMRNDLLEIIGSDNSVIVRGKIVDLQQNKEPVSEVLSGRECGIVIQFSMKKKSPKEGDKLQTFKEVRKHI
jgi:translation initiation factor IF-2